MQTSLLCALFVAGVCVCVIICFFLFYLGYYIVLVLISSRLEHLG